jgi:hypothetical protein
MKFKKYLTPENVFSKQRQIKDAIWVNGQFILTQQEVLDIVKASKCKHRGQTLMNKHALELIEMFKLKVTPKVWTNWINWNPPGDDRISNILNLFHELYTQNELN